MFKLLKEIFGQPWRKHSEDFKWNKEYSEELKTNASEVVTKNECKPTLLLFGPSGHGKSTIINSVSTISQGRKSNITNSATTVSHATSVFRKYNLPGKLCNFHMADIKGIVVKETDNASLVDNVVRIIKGNIKPGIEFNQIEFSTEGDFYNESPKEDDKVQCVIFVFDIRQVTADGVAKSIYKQYVTKLLDHLHHLDVPRIVILTHADKIDEKVDRKIQFIFRSTKVKEAVEYASELFGIPLENIHPIKNYANTSVAFTDPLLHIPILLAIQQALYFANDTLVKRRTL